VISVHLPKRDEYRNNIMTDTEINSWKGTSRKDQLISFRRILVVDDDPCIREIISVTLLGCGNKVDTAKDGADAWKALNDVSYHLLITDYKMPIINGLELVRKLRSKDRMMPVILMSGIMPTDELKRHAWLRVDGLLSKPFTVAELVGVVKKVARMLETSFAVPIRQPQKLEIEFKASPASSFKKPIASPGQMSWAPHILLVDDDCKIRQLAVELLTDSGYNVEQAKDGAAGWLAIQSNTYDLIITDNKMSRMTGIEMIEKMKAARISTPIIMATGNLPIYGFVQKPWLKPNAMLQRPFSNGDLLEAVKRVLHPVNPYGE
jgi:DNA-binding response OmpR family regulator